ncbi:MAG: response regulator receiver protein [Bacillota bacterium]|jgi:two-component system chemotaxis response regulator CheY|nr:response regulator receiver protein [Bacillota bacterium]
MKILIAEDDLISRSFLNKFLEKYGECDLVVDGLETLDAFLIALKEKEPYDLICLDIMMPKVDGVKTLKAIRDLEKQYGITPENRAKIIMTTALAEAQLVRTAFDYGCEAYAAKPIDTGKFVEVLEKLGLIKEAPDGSTEQNGGIVPKNDENPKNTTKQSMQNDRIAPRMLNGDTASNEGYFKSVLASSDYQLEVTMETGTVIHFDFRPRLNTARFGMLKDEKLFRSVQTDGDYLIFHIDGKMPVKITASEFMDLVLIDRRK